MSNISRRSLMKASVTGLGAAAVATLSGCGTSQEPNSTSSNGATSAQNGVKELIIATATTPWLDSYKAIVDTYEAETGIKATLQPFPFDGLLTQQINAMQQRSNAFDLFQINEGWVGQFYGQGWMRTLQDIDPSFEWDQGIASFDGVSNWDADKQVTDSEAPAVAMPLNGNIHIFAYRRDIYEELGLTPPATWDEAIANGKKAMDAGKIKYGYVTRGQGAPGGNSVSFDFGAILHSYGVEYFKQAGSDWTPTINTPEAHSAMAKYLELLSLGPANPQTVDQAGVIAALQSGDALQGHMVVAIAPQLEDQDKSQISGRVGYAVVPGGSAGPSPVSGAWTIGVPVGVPDDRAKAALDFMKWLLSKPIQKMWGESGGVITRSDVLQELGESGNHPDLAAMQASLSHVHAGIRYPFGPKMLQSTEVNFNRIVAGQVSIAEGMKQIADDIAAAVKEAGL